MEAARRRVSEALSVYWERRLVAVFFMGFVSGLPFYLSGATLSIWLTEVGVSLTDIGLFALVATPYTLKFLWAPALDRVSLPVLARRLGRRRAWMLVIQLALMAAIVALGSSTPESTPQVTAALALVVALCSASQDVVIDAYRIDVLDDDQQGAGAAMTQAGYRLGLIVSGALALYLASVVAWSVVYAIMAAFVLVGIVTTLLAPVPRDPDERPVDSGGWLEKLAENDIEPFLELFRRRGVRIALAILGFILLFKLGDAFANVMANPFYILLGFTKIQVATASKIFGIAATLLGVFTGGVLVKRLGVLRCLLLGGVLQMASNLMFAALAAVGPSYGFLFATVGVENFSAGVGSAAFVAYLSLLCNASYTGTQYALFTSLMAVGRTWLSSGSGWVAEHTDWVTFFVISTVVAVPGLVLLVWMIRRLPLDSQRAG